MVYFGGSQYLLGLLFCGFRLLLRGINRKGVRVIENRSLLLYNCKKPVMIIKKHNPKYCSWLGGREHAVEAAAPPLVIGYQLTR